MPEVQNEGIHVPQKGGNVEPHLVISCTGDFQSGVKPHPLLNL